MLGCSLADWGRVTLQLRNLDPYINFCAFIFILSDPVGALDQIFIFREADERNAYDLFIAVSDWQRALSGGMLTRWASSAVLSTLSWRRQLMGSSALTEVGFLKMWETDERPEWVGRYRLGRWYWFRQQGLHRIWLYLPPPKLSKLRSCALIITYYGELEAIISGGEQSKSRKNLSTK